MPAAASVIFRIPYSNCMRSSLGAWKSLLRNLFDRGFLGTTLCLLCFCSTSTAQGIATTQEQMEGSHEEGVSVLGVFTVMLVIGVASYHVLAFTRIPYTAILIVRLCIREIGCPRSKRLSKAYMCTQIRVASSSSRALNSDICEAPVTSQKSKMSMRSVLIN